MVEGGNERKGEGDVREGVEGWMEKEREWDERERERERGGGGGVEGWKERERDERETSWCCPAAIV